MAGIVQKLANATLVAANAKTGDTFFALTSCIKTGAGTQTLSDANDTVAAGYYEATTLAIIDAHLVADNIKKDINIFGVTGTVESGTLATDVSGSDDTSAVADSTATLGYNSIDIAGTAETVLATKTLTFDADSMQVIVGFAALMASDLNQLQLRLYADGVKVAEGDPITNMTQENHVLIGYSELDGAKACELRIYNIDSSTHSYTAVTSDSGIVLPFAIGIGSIKK